MKVSAILLAGGKGKRMGSQTPKQFLQLQCKTIALHSLEVLRQLDVIDEVVVVCEPEFYHIFDGLPVIFAPPGAERQDSVFNGFQMTKPHAEWICIHDSARPFINASMIHDLFLQGVLVGAASLALPVKNTIKESTTEERVARTLDRNYIWEIQTPQLIRKEILEAGFAHLKAQGGSVTDDVSLAELIGHPVKLVRGHSYNLKITTPEDLAFAEWLCCQNLWKSYKNIE